MFCRNIIGVGEGNFLLKIHRSRTKLYIILFKKDKNKGDKFLAFRIKILLKNYAKIPYFFLTNGYKNVIIFRR